MSRTPGFKAEGHGEGGFGLSNVQNIPLMTSLKMLEFPNPMTLNSGSDDASLLECAEFEV